MAKKKPEQPKEDTPVEKTKYLTIKISDPAQADRELKLDGAVVELKAGEASKQVTLTEDQAKELKERFPYLLVE